jgi:RNA polymerase sigma-70 factor (ECF subfamily)
MNERFRPARTTPPDGRLNAFGGCAASALRKDCRRRGFWRRPFEERDRALDDTDVHPLLSAYMERREDLLRYFRVRLRSDEAAEDLVQDIYLKIVDRRAEAIDNPAAYLYRLGTNLMLDRIKVRRRAQARDAQWHGAHVSDIGGDQVVDEVPADEATAAKQQLSRVLEAVEAMPPPAREAFRLHKLEGLTHAETAAAMGVSRSSVEKYMMASLKLIVAKVGRWP